MDSQPESPEPDGEPEPASDRTFSQRMLDGIERVGNKVPHPVIIFLYLIGAVIVISAILGALGVEVTEERLQPGLSVAEPQWVGGSDRPVTQAEFDDYGIQIEYVLVEEDVPVRSLLSVDGLRFIFTSFVGNFASFSVVAVIIVAMIGVGVAEQAGLMAALIRALVNAAPRQLLTFVIVLIGILSSVATDAGYLILVPLGAAAFLSVGRHPLAGIAAAFGGVSGVFAVNILIAPVDALVTEITNEAIAVVDPEATITITANLYFGIVSTIVLAIVVTLITERLIEPRLGTYNPDEATDVETGQEMPVPEDAPEIDKANTSRGLRYGLYGLLGAVAVIALLTLLPGAPLRDPVDGSIIGNTPFMDSLIFLITLIFLVCGITYGIGARTISGSTDVINAITKTFAGLAGLIFMLLVISQFIAFFNYTNMPRVLASSLATVLSQADVRPTFLLVGFIVVIALLNILIPNVVPKWAIFAPMFVPLFSELGIAPQTVLAAYRVGDSPTNVITPLMVYLPFILLVAQRYQKSAGLGTIISLMIPYSIIILIVWIILFVAWFLLGLPLGPGYPVDIS
jgi:aminobenzoyl-glutamate transport protein